MRQQKRNCPYQGEALIVPTAFYGQWTSENMKKMCREKNEQISAKQSIFSIFHFSFQWLRSEHAAQFAKLLAGAIWPDNLF